MSLYNKVVDCINNWDEEVFRSLHHPDFLLIRETELTTLEDHLKEVFAAENPSDAFLLAQSELVHENPYVMESRIYHKNNTVTIIVGQKRDGLIWRVTRNTQQIRKTI